jgi:glyoxylase-like metal-dependent hydrolase (beta-lactamase superfamily II)
MPHRQRRQRSRRHDPNIREEIMSRAHLSGLAIATLAAIATTAAHAQPQRPQSQTTKVEGTDNVYIFRYVNHQSMFVVTKDGVIATDPIGLARPQAVTTYIDEIKKVSDKPIKYVIYSHHHYDHIAGGKPFKTLGATFFAHENVKARLAPLKDPDTVLPDRTVGNGGSVITLGGTRLELHYVGRNHSDSSLVMRLPKEKIIFAVDFLPVGQVPGVAMVDSYPMEWEESAKKVLAMDWQRLIPGHPGPGDRLGTKDDAQNMLTLLQDASAEVKSAAREGKCWQPEEKEFKLPKYASWPGYENGLPFIARRYCALWGRGTE